MENDDSKMIVKQNMLILVHNTKYIMLNWIKNDDLKLVYYCTLVTQPMMQHRLNPTEIRSLYPNFPPPSPLITKN